MMKVERATRRWLVIGGLGLSIVAAACSKNSPSGTGGSSGGGAGCSPNGTSLTETAKGTAFGTSCLAAPANQDFTIAFDNQDQGIPHSIVITKDGTAVFTGDVITGPTQTTYNVPGMAAGTYGFNCSVHPTKMIGTFIVK